MFLRVVFEKIIEKIASIESGSTLIGPLGRVEINNLYYKPLIGVRRNAVFCDGGNGAVFSSPNCRVEFVRLCAITYEGDERKEIVKKEGVLFLRRKNGKIIVEGEDFEFSIVIEENDDELRVGYEIVSIERVAGVCRFILECKFLLQFDGLLVRDGPLIARNKYEQEALAPFLKRESVGVVKAHSVVSENGLSAENVLERKGVWSYSIGSEGDIELFMARLSPNTKHLFRIDCVGESEAIIGYLSTLNDPTFLGYPYPLVLADRLGRVGERELAGLKMRFMAESKEKWKSFENAMHGSDAHSVLDNM